MTFRRGLLILLMTIALALGSVLPTLAQDESIAYADPDGRFSATIPAGWTDVSTAEYGRFANPDGIEVSLLAVAAEDVETGITAALAIVAPDVTSDPVQINDIPLANGIWTQYVYAPGDGSIEAVLAQIKDGVAYMLVAHFPNPLLLQSAGQQDVNAILFSYTIGEPIDLTGITPAPFDKAMAADLDAYIEETMRYYHIPGAAVAVVQNGEIVYAQGFGVRDIDGVEPVTEDTLFMIGSVTKSMTSFIMATLVDDGALAWDAPVVDILPDFALSDPTVTPTIRVRDLLGMSSGVPRFDVPLFTWLATPQEIIGQLATISLTAQPGEKFQYSNQMVAAGGYLAAVAAGASYDGDLLEAYAQLLQTRLLDPAGMSRTTLDLDAALASPNHALPHQFDMQTEALKLTPPNYERFVEPVAPAGAVWSSVTDMARYLQTQMRRGVAPGGTRIVAEANLLETWRGHVTAFGESQYAMGWIDDEYNGLRLIWHNGGTAGFSANLVFLPDANIGVVILSNRALADNFTQAVPRRVFEQVFGLEHTADAQLKAAEEQLNQMVGLILQRVEVSDVGVDPDQVKDYLGEYEHRVTVALGDDGRLIAATDFGDLPLTPTPERDDTYIFLDILVQVQFASTADNGETTMTIKPLLDMEGTGLSLTLKKVE